MTEEESRQYAPVLAYMIETCASTNMKFGEAFRLGCGKAGIDPQTVPQEIESALLVTVFRIMATKRIPGAPDA